MAGRRCTACGLSGNERKKAPTRVRDREDYNVRAAVGSLADRALTAATQSLKEPAKIALGLEQQLSQAYNAAVGAGPDTTWGGLGPWTRIEQPLPGSGMAEPIDKLVPKGEAWLVRGPAFVEFSYNPLNHYFVATSGGSVGLGFPSSDGAGLRHDYEWIREGTERAKLNLTADEVAELDAIITEERDRAGGNGLWLPGVNDCGSYASSLGEQAKMRSWLKKHGE
jgi:hypothetical protein